ncbi:hypothetical protein [Synechococcus sp. CBW1006]|uniref:hypothetical protein n=1 Tax=Synechococcus sp. CBW1006 TaxID=1353138 RepID=UPI0018CE3A15|nr:hypothetical protein [Synechococcus sp. CBW1006]QPN66524.1 hypothetical protein H8F26_17645 [Synechococcus sp. CBW1006]
MSFGARRTTHLSRLLMAQRKKLGLRPGQVAALLGATNISRVGSLIGCFEVGEPITDQWLEKLINALKRDPEELRRCLELDQEEAEQQLEADRRAWEAWADEPMDAYVWVRYMPAVYGVRDVPKAFCNSREQAEGWASRELRRFRAKGYLQWTRREQTWFDQYGINPRRLPVTFENSRPIGGMQVGQSQRRFLLGSDGQVITGGYGLLQAGQSGSTA